MATQAVTELVIDAGPAERGEARYQAAMERIAAAEQRRIDRQAKIEAAMEKGVAVVTQTTTALDRQARAWESVVAKVDPAAKAHLAAEREMERAVHATTTAVENGFTTQAQAERTLAALRQQQVVKIEEVRAAQMRLTQATDQEAAATTRLAQAQARAHGGGNFHAVNLGFQAQDIAMMTLMGQAPAMLALQQGLQVGGIFSQMGSGKAIVQGLAGAVGMLLNPLNLATIAVIGLGAAGVQAFMHMQSANDSTVKTLEEHTKWLDKVLVGYEDAKDAADGYLAEAAKLPRGVVASDLAISLKKQEEARVALDRQAADLREMLMAAAGSMRATNAFNPGMEQFALGLISQVDQLSKLRIAATSTREELENVASAAHDLYNTTKDPGLKDMADQVYQTAMRMLNLRNQTESTDAALRHLPKEVQIRIAVNTNFNKNLEALQALYVDPRSQFDVQREQAKNTADELSATAHSYSELVGIGNEYKRVLDSIDAAEAKAAAKHHTPKTDAEKSEDAYKKLIRSTQQSIAQQQMQAQTLGMTNEQARAFLNTQNLLNAAANSNIKLTPQMEAELRSYGATMASVEANAARITDIYNTGRDATRGFFGDMLNYLRQSAAGWKNFGDFAKSALDAATQAASNLINKLADKALSGVADALWSFGFNAFSGGGGWNIPTSYQPNGFYPAFPSANGNVFNNAPGLNAYANTIVNRPTLFPFAKGIGLMGETGEPGEAIMPLGRNSRGQLGVQVASRNHDNDNIGTVNVNIYNEAGQPVQGSASVSRSRNGNIDIKVQLKALAVAGVKEELANGGFDGLNSSLYGLKRRGR